MKSIFLVLICFVIKRSHCRSANDFLKDVFSMEDESLKKEEPCSTMECQTAGNLYKLIKDCYLCVSW